MARFLPARQQFCKRIGKSSHCKHIFSSFLPSFLNVYTRFLLNTLMLLRLSFLFPDPGLLHAIQFFLLYLPVRIEPFSCLLSQHMMAAPSLLGMTMAESSCYPFACESCQRNFRT